MCGIASITGYCQCPRVLPVSPAFWLTTNKAWPALILCIGLTGKVAWNQHSVWVITCNYLKNALKTSSAVAVRPASWKKTLLWCPYERIGQKFLLLDWIVTRRRLFSTWIIASSSSAWRPCPPRQSATLMAQCDIFVSILFLFRCCVVALGYRWKYIFKVFVFRLHIYFWWYRRQFIISK